MIPPEDMPRTVGFPYVRRDLSIASWPYAPTVWGGAVLKLPGIEEEDES